MDSIDPFQAKFSGIHVFRRRIIVSVFSLAVTAVWATSPLQAQSPISAGPLYGSAYRAQIRSMPIELRPNRPFHFYGNTVRRRQQRVNPAPQTPVSTPLYRVVTPARRSVVVPTSVGAAYPYSIPATIVDRRFRYLGR